MLKASELQNHVQELKQELKNLEYLEDGSQPVTQLPRNERLAS